MPQTRYRCHYCQQDKFLPERPLNPQPNIRTGCTSCARITRHDPVGCVR